MIANSKKLTKDEKKIQKLFDQLYELVKTGDLNLSEKKREALVISVERVKGHISNMQW